MKEKIIIPFIISFVASIFSLFVALWVEKRRLPKLEIIASEDVNRDNTYPHNGERWKFFRVLVKNKPFIFPFGWITRQTAENCRAKIEFSKISSDDIGFSMIGRWASTPELSIIKNDPMLKILNPDPVTIAVNEEEYLDVFVKYEKDKDAYGWNNEAYLNKWRTPHYKLERGTYNLKVSISTQNGITFIKKFQIIISDSIEDTLLKNL